MVAGKAIENPKELGEKTETQAKGEGRHNKKCSFSGRATKTPLKPPKPHRKTIFSPTRKIGIALFFMSLP